MTTQKGVGPGGQPIFEDSGNPGVALTNLSEDGGDILASAAAWIDSHHTVLDAVPALGSGVAAWLATPSSFNLFYAVTGSTGSGAVVFGSGPQITQPTIVSGLFMKEQAAPPTEVSGFAHFWCKTVSPNELWLTDDEANHFNTVTPVAPSTGNCCRITSAGAYVWYTTADPTDEDENGTALAAAVAALTDGDTLIIGPGVYYTTDLNILTHEDIKVISHAEMIQRPDSTASYAMFYLSGNRIDLHLGSTIVDGNRQGNRSAIVATTNEHHGIVVTYPSTRIRIFGGKIQNTGVSGTGINTTNVEDGLEIHGTQIDNCGRSLRIRARQYWFTDVTVTDPYECDVTEIASHALLTSTDLDLYDAAYLQDDGRIFRLDAEDHTIIGNWTDVTGSFARWMTGDNGMADSKGVIERCRFISGYFANMTIDLDSRHAESLRFRDCYFRNDKSVSSHVDHDNIALCKIQYIKNVEFQGCWLDSPNYAGLYFTPYDPTARLIFKDTYLSGNVDLDSSKTSLIHIENTEIGGHDLGVVNEALEQINTDRLYIHNSRIGGSLVYAISVEFSRATDVWDIQNNTFSAVRAPGASTVPHAVTYNNTDLYMHDITWKNNEVNACEGGFIASVTSTTVFTLPDNFDNTNDIYKGRAIEITRGPGRSDFRTIISNTGREVTLDRALEELPTTISFARIYWYHIGRVQSATTTTIVIDPASPTSSQQRAPDTDDVFNTMIIEIIDGPAKGTKRTISDYTGSGGSPPFKCTISTAYTTQTGTPNNLSQYRIYPASGMIHMHTSNSSARRLLLTNQGDGKLRWSEYAGDATVDTYRGVKGSIADGDRHPDPEGGANLNFNQTWGWPGAEIINTSPDGTFDFTHWRWEEEGYGSWTEYGAWVGYPRPLPAMPSTGDSVRITSAGAVTHYKTTDLDDGEANATALEEAVAAITNGDTLIIGPGVYYTTDLDIEADNIKIISHAQLIQRPDSTDSIRVVTVNGDNVRVEWNRTIIDNNRTGNPSARSGANDHNGLNVVGSNHTHIGGFIRNIGELGYGFQMDSSFSGYCNVHGMVIEEGGYASYRMRSIGTWLLDACVSINPKEFDTTEVGSEAAMLASGTAPYAGVFRTDTDKFMFLNQGTLDPTVLADWSDHTTSSYRRHLTTDNLNGVCSRGIVRNCFFYADYYAAIVNDPASYPIQTLDIDGLYMWNGYQDPGSETAFKNLWFENLRVRNTTITGHAHESMSFATGGAMRRPSVLLDNFYCSGHIDCDDVQFETFKICNGSKIGAWDFDDTYGLEQIRARNLEITDSEISGGASTIRVETYLPTDRWKIENNRFFVVKEIGDSVGYAILPTSGDGYTSHVIWQNNELNAAEGGAAQSGSTSTTIVLSLDASATDSVYIGRHVECNGESKAITAYVGATRTATIDDTWTTTPVSGDRYRIPWILYGDVLAATSTTVDLDLSASETNDTYNTLTIEIVEGTAKGESQTISDYTGSSRQCVTGSWTTTPDTTSKYRIYGSVLIRPTNASTRRLRLTGDRYHEMVFDETFGVGTGSNSEKHPDMSTGSPLGGITGQPGLVIRNKMYPDTSYTYAEWRWDDTEGDWVPYPLTGYAEISAEGNTTDTSISSSSTNFSNAVQVDAFDTNHASSENATPDHTNDHITINVAGIYFIVAELSFSGGVSDTYSFALFKNNGPSGTQITKRSTRKLGTGGDIGHASCSGIASLSATDTVEVWIQNEDDADDVKVQDVTLSLHKIG